MMLALEALIQKEVSNVALRLDIHPLGFNELLAVLKRRATRLNYTIDEREITSGLLLPF